MSPSLTAVEAAPARPTADTRRREGIRGGGSGPIRRSPPGRRHIPHPTQGPWEDGRQLLAPTADARRGGSGPRPSFAAGRRRTRPTLVPACRRDGRRLAPRPMLAGGESCVRQMRPPPVARLRGGG
ncbi:hypothetical protein GQ55_3G120800 [Panicum hallii var. hallii]|uniref:Uncharacterized protein n=1 Tax=Panicum hallii var. hallii TaxID=1504633 RepID=A0A2T7E8L5_9POAL|nr:hypothetical protein GQ55_3G120800 [Panicum hallii var. hallii]